MRKIIRKNKHLAKVIAKIEKPEAVRNIDSIIKVANGIMVARGDLGVEMPIEQLPAIQKMIVKKCIQRARTVIVATQMLDSMEKSPTPTRAEVTDVANAVNQIIQRRVKCSKHYLSIMTKTCPVS